MSSCLGPSPGVNFFLSFLRNMSYEEINPEAIADVFTA
jgi:hypothetical protein